MKSKRLAAGVIGISLFVSILLTFVWFLSPGNSKSANELTLEEALTRIRNKETSEVLFKQDSVELTDKSSNKFFIKLDAGAAPREALLKVSTKSGTTVTFEPASSGYSWLLLFNALPVVLFFVMWIATLAVIVYAAKVLSRNKS